MTGPSERPPTEQLAQHRSPEGAFYSATSSGDLSVPGVTINIPAQNNQNSESSWKSLGMVVAVAGLLLAAIFGGFQAGTYYMESVVDDAVEKAVSENSQTTKERLDALELQIQELLRDLANINPRP